MNIDLRTGVLRNWGTTNNWRDSEVKVKCRKSPVAGPGGSVLQRELERRSQGPDPKPGLRVDRQRIDGSWPQQGLVDGEVELGVGAAEAESAHIVRLSNQAQSTKGTSVPSFSRQKRD